MIDITVDIRGAEEFRHTARALGKSVNDVRFIRKFLRPGVKPIRDSIRAVTPQSKAPHYYYRKGKKITTFLPGHLKKSTQDISQLKRGYKMVPVIYVGPVYTRKAGQGGTLGGNVKAVDAFYAHMVYGAAAAYEKRVINAGFQSARPVAEAAIVAQASKDIEKAGVKAGFSR